MSVIELAITKPTNNAVFDGLSSTVTFEGSVSTSAGAPTTSGLYFKWFSTVAPWASETGGGNAHINTALQGTNALSFPTSSPGGGSWGMGTQWVQFACMNTDGMDKTALEGVSTNGIDGGRNTITLSEWTVNPRKIHILDANIVHPSHDSRFACNLDDDQFKSPVELYGEVRAVMPWISGGVRNTHSVNSWPGDSDIDDELVLEFHSGSIGTAGDAIFKSDVDASTFVCDLLNGSVREYTIPCLSWDWSTGAGSKTLYLLVYHKDNRVTSGPGSVSTSTSFVVVASCRTET